MPGVKTAIHLTGIQPLFSREAIEKIPAGEVRTAINRAEV
jgi:hypothetical protein